MPPYLSDAIIMSNSMIVLPARLASTRLAEKLLKLVGGKSILQHTYEAASRSKLATQILVAVDDQKLAEEVESFAGNWKLTSRACESGTDRVAEIASSFPEIDYFVNVQADEPEISGDTIDLVLNSLRESPDADMATAGTPIRKQSQLDDPSCVKIVMGDIKQRDFQYHEDTTSISVEADKPKTEVARGQGRAIYFSRAAVPHLRDGILPDDFHRIPPVFWHHVGIYAYRRAFLDWFTKTKPSFLERAEKLEQLRAIEAGKAIQVVEIEHAAAGIDTAQDLEDFRLRLNRPT